MADFLREITVVALVEESLSVQVSLIRRQQEKIAHLEARMQAPGDHKAAGHSPDVVRHPCTSGLDAVS